MPDNFLDKKAILTVSYKVCVFSATQNIIQEFVPVDKHCQSYDQNT
jgi:hypothetical protein